MKTTTFGEASEHLKDVLGITLTDHLEFSSRTTLRNYSVLGSLVLVYRYAEAIGRKFVIHHMTTDGHKSHLLGTELDFDLSFPRKDPLQQIHVIADMLRIRDALRSNLNAFRLGFYFDQLNDAEAEAANSLEKFNKTYKGVGTAASMHVGVRYKWNSDEYRGNALGGNSLIFGMWGRGGKTFGRSDRWVNRLLRWDVGFLRLGCSQLATKVLLDDFRMLDRYPSGYRSTLVDNASGCHLPAFY